MAETKVGRNEIEQEGDWIIAPVIENNWVYVKLANNFTNSATSNAASPLAFTPIANTHYEIEGKFFLQSSATTTGARPGISWPSGLNQNVAWMVAPSSATAFVSRFWGNTSAANASSTATAIINESFYGQVQAMIVTGSSPSGNFTITLASEIAASEVRIMANSFIRYRVVP